MAHGVGESHPYGLGVSEVEKVSAFFIVSLDESDRYSACHFEIERKSLH